jgi:hypothetical protein
MINGGYEHHLKCFYLPGFVAGVPLVHEPMAHNTFMQSCTKDNTNIAVDVATHPVDVCSSMIG